MSEPRRLLEAIREELRNTVLPRIEGDYERSVVIAMLGILRDVAPEITLDTSGAAGESERLADALAQACVKLGDGVLASSIAESAAAADRAPGAAARRAILLEAVEALVRELWRDPALADARTLVLPILRSALKP